jgi:hypothetical protein
MVQTAVDGFQALEARIRSALQGGLAGGAQLTVQEGYMGRAHVKVVSEGLNGLLEDEKQRIVWAILREALGADAQDVAFVIPYGTDEL